MRDRDDHTTSNLFVPRGEAEIQDFEREFGDVLPSAYLAFLRQIGTGWLTEDITGGDTYDYENSFLSTAAIAEILRRSSVEWSIYPDFIDEDEVPFFSWETIRFWFSGEGTEPLFIILSGGPHLHGTSTNFLRA
ncbi:hypothetical protein AU381_16200 [Sinorhizobium glycinis]|uniref:Knr4/Smi1-like domain-containing protein n=1 Tax=Sinorhizobium glycinis TaxID=1472378 RepID=A0A178Y558_9HYPH|nr:SMI1/KNR4 family protein [Sinorhizobium glycinis]OAP42709.1 hypothetical protein AU381_16200 [Sinorhizobium glycinis]